MQFFNLILLGNVRKLLQEAFQIALERERKTLLEREKESDIRNGQQEEQKQNYESIIH